MTSPGIVFLKLNPCVFQNQYNVKFNTIKREFYQVFKLKTRNYGESKNIYHAVIPLKTHQTFIPKWGK